MTAQAQDWPRFHIGVAVGESELVSPTGPMPGFQRFLADESVESGTALED